MKLIDRIKLAWNFVFNYKSNEKMFDSIFKHNNINMCYRCKKVEVKWSTDICSKCFDILCGD